MKTPPEEKRLTNPKSISYTLIGKPIPLARPRFANGHVFDSQTKEKIIMGLQLNSHHKGRPLFAGLLRLDVIYFMPTPRAKKHLEGRYHGVRADLDNLIKMTLDTANGLLFHDDAQIAIINACKKYSREPRTEFTLTEIE